MSNSVLPWHEEDCLFCGCRVGSFNWGKRHEAIICDQCVNDALWDIRAAQRKDRLPAKPKRHTTRKRVIERDKGMCRYCGVVIEGKIHLDHVVPYSLGGRTDLDNLVTTCSNCNLKKGARTPDQAGMTLREVV